jgi:hypothetical protein
VLTAALDLLGVDDHHSTDFYPLSQHVIPVHISTGWSRCVKTHTLV